MQAPSGNSYNTMNGKKNDEEQDTAGQATVAYTDDDVPDVAKRDSDSDSKDEAIDYDGMVAGESQDIAIEDYSDSNKLNTHGTNIFTVEGIQTSDDSCKEDIDKIEMSNIIDATGRNGKTDDDGTLAADFNDDNAGSFLTLDGDAGMEDKLVEDGDDGNMPTANTPMRASTTQANDTHSYRMEACTITTGRGSSLQQTMRSSQPEQSPNHLRGNPFLVAIAN